MNSQSLSAIEKIQKIGSDLKYVKQQMSNYIDVLTIGELVELVSESCGCKKIDLIEAISYEKRLKLVSEMTKRQLDKTRYNVGLLQTSIMLSQLLDPELIKKSISEINAMYDSDDSESDSESEDESKTA